MMADDVMKWTKWGMLLKVVAALLVLPATTLSEEPISKTEEDLLTDLLLHYKERTRPRKDPNQPVEVSLKYMLRSIDELDERRQHLLTFGWLFASWYDDYLTWQPMDYSNLTTINIPSKLLWRPDLVVQNSAGSMHSELTNEESAFQMWVSSDGLVVLVTGGRIKTACQLDTTYFPFDSQACHIIIDSWSFDTTKCVFGKAELDLKSYRRNGEWNLIDTNATIRRYPGEFERSFEAAQYTLYLDRKPLYYVTNIIIPCAALSLLVALVFILPPDAGDKVSLCTTLLLSFTVFILLVAEHMPITSDFTSVLAVYVVFSMVLSALSLVCTLVVLNLHHSNAHHRVPGCILKVMARFSQCVTTTTNHTRQIREEYPDRLICQHCNDISVNNENTPRSDQRSDIDSLRNSLDEHRWMLRNIHSKFMDDQADVRSRKEWLELAKLCDRFFLFLFLCMELVCITVLLGILPSTGSPRVDPITEE